MKLIIAEKHSVAQNIAHTIGAYERLKLTKDSKIFCYANDEYYVAYAKGHLYSLAEPNEYGWNKNIKKCYENGELPMIPSRFKTVPNNDSFNELRNFLNELINNKNVTELINACDAGREGELIFREIYEKSGSTKPVTRFWVSSVTETAILDGLKNLKPSAEYDNYYRSAKTRAKLDWIYGMNLSRLYTALDEGYIHTVGRVVTPVLGLIVNRDNEIRNFVPKTTYKLILDNGAVSDDEFADRNEAEKYISAEQKIVVESAVSEQKKNNSPKLYSLTRLQMDANDEYGYTANETLSLAQSLYEKKYITYPRTNSECLSNDLYETVAELLKMFAIFPEYAERIEKIKLNPQNHIFNSNEVTDHHAIIPTLQGNINLSDLSEKEQNIYRLIVNRLLMSLDTPFVYIENNYIFNCNNILFSLKSISPVELGWKKYSKDNNEEKYSYDKYTEGQQFVSNVCIKECVSQPLKHYTDKTLLSVMLNIDNRIEDADLKSAVKGKGLGTEATRASIIDKLVNTKYVERKGKQLIATEFGCLFAKSLPKQLLSVERTAEWEQLFDEIESSGADDTSLYEDTCQIVRAVINYEKENNKRTKLVNPNPQKTNAICSCPRCGKDIVDRGNFFGCSSWQSADNPGCGFSIPKEHSKGWFEGKISPTEVKALCSGGTVQKNTTSADGKKYKAEWKIFDDGIYVSFVKEKSTKKGICKCPRCGKDIVDRGNFFGCSSWQSADNPGCGWALFKYNKKWNVTITAKNVKELIEHGTTIISEKTLNGDDTQKYSIAENEVNGKRYVNLVPDGGK